MCKANNLPSANIIQYKTLGTSYYRKSAVPNCLSIERRMFFHEYHGTHHEDPKEATTDLG